MRKGERLFKYELVTNIRMRISAGKQIRKWAFPFLTIKGWMNFPELVFGKLCENSPGNFNLVFVETLENLRLEPPRKFCPPPVIE